MPPPPVRGGKGKGKGRGGPLIKGKASAVPVSSRLPTEDWEIKYDDIEVFEQIGSGGFGSVKRARWKGTDVAVKELWVQEPDYVDSLKTEVAVTAALRHPNVVLFMGACTRPPKLAMVTEYVAGGNLRHLLNDDNAVLGWGKRCSMALDATRAFAYIHGKGMMHRDIKTYNLLVTTNGLIKVCDMGLARVVPRTLKMTVKGTDYYMAPEVTGGKPYGKAADVYSFGIVLWELLTRELPDDLADMLKGDPTLARAKVDPGCPADLRTLAEECVSPDPSKRPSFDAMVPRLEKALASCAQEAGGSGAGAGAVGSAASSSIAIADARGRAFWSSKFGEAKKAPWSDFADALAAAVPLPLKDVERLSSHLKDPLEKGWVTQSTFSTFLAWFGGAFPSAVRDGAALFALDYFVGNVNQDAAQAMLEGAGDGTFVARISASRPGCFSVAVVKGGKVRHSAVLRDAEGRLTIDNKRSFPDLPSFVEAHKFLFAKAFKKKV